MKCLPRSEGGAEGAAKALVRVRNNSTCTMKSPKALRAHHCSLMSQYILDSWCIFNVLFTEIKIFFFFLYFYLFIYSDYVDILYMRLFKTAQHFLDSIDHSALCFITKAGHSTHHCDLYSLSGWPSLSVCRQLHWDIFIYKAIIVLLPSQLFFCFLAVNEQQI